MHIRFVPFEGAIPARGDRTFAAHAGESAVTSRILAPRRVVGVALVSAAGEESDATEPTGYAVMEPYIGVPSSTSVPNGSRTNATRWPWGLSSGAASDSQPASTAIAYAASTSVVHERDLHVRRRAVAAGAPHPAREARLAERVGGEGELRRSRVELRVGAVGGREVAAQSKRPLVERARRRRILDVGDDPPEGQLQVSHVTPICR